MIAAPFIYVAANERGYHSITTFIDGADFIGVAIVLSAGVLWLSALLAWYRTRQERSESANFSLLVAVIVGSVFTAYFWYVKRARIFPTLCRRSTAANQLAEATSVEPAENRDP